MVILSHTNPDYPLEQHLLHTRNIALRLMPKSKEAKNYGLENLVRITTETHDLGKATTWFQQYLQGKYNGGLKEHAYISACFAHYVAEKEGLNVWQRAAAYFIVLGHHGHLKHKIPSKDLDAELLQKQAKNILHCNTTFVETAQRKLPSTHKYVEEFLRTAGKTPNAILKEIRKTLKKLGTIAAETDLYENVKRFLTTKMAYSLLVSADIISAALRTDKIDELLNAGLPTPEMLDKFVQKLPKHRKIDKVRSFIYKQAQETQIKNKINILELPTGAGKTFTGLRLITTAERPVIYTLPYTSIIDQTVGILQKDELYDGNVMPYHHLSAGAYCTRSSKDADKRKDDEYAGTYDEYQRKIIDRLTEGWFAPITVTTYEQVMYTLTWDKKRFAQRMHTIGRSAVIFDEIQALPANIWDATWYVLKAMNELFETPILVMSATVPVVPEHAQDAVIELPVRPPQNAEDVFVRRVFEYKPGIDSTGAVADLVVKLSEKHNRVLCVVNTRCDAYELYENVKNRVEKEVILLSTHIPPEERLSRIHQIKDKLHEWVVISTQVIEAGVDIDADALVRDIAPLDSIIQSAGRCNRNGEREMGKVIIVEIRDENGRLRATRVYRDTFVTVTQEILAKMPKNADDKWMERALKEYYIKIHEKTKKESEEGYESIPVKMGKMRFEEVRDAFQLIKEIPAFQIILADRKALSIIEKIRKLKEQMKSENGYEKRIGIAKQIRALRTALEQKAVSIYKPSSDNSKAQRMLEYLLEKAGDAMEKLEIYDDTYLLVLEKLPKDLRRKTEEVGISWICEAKTKDIDDQMDRFA